jgi:hypothetical protein
MIELRELSINDEKIFIICSRILKEKRTDFIMKLRD